MGGEWASRRLGDLFQLEYGRSLPESNRRRGLIPVVGSAGVVGTHDTSARKGPGIVVGRKGSIGRVTWVRGDYWPIDTTYYVAPSEAGVHLRWIYHLLTTERLERFNRATGV